MVMLRHSDRRHKSEFIITYPDQPAEGGEMLMCAHCAMHFRVEPGSGRKRGYCFRCAGVTCGVKRSCETRCRPWEAQIEAMERAGRRAALDGAISRTRGL